MANNDIDADPDDAAGPDLARLAHELRTPLSAIAMLSEIMRDERLGRLDDARYRAYAADIHDSASHAMSVLSSFLDASQGHDARLDGRPRGLPMDFVEIDLERLAGGTVSALTPLAGKMGVSLAIECQGGLPRLIGDQRSVRQILNNLIANGLKATPPGGRITVRVAYAVGGPVRLEVADSGDGMTASELSRARLGATAPEPIRRRSGGTGFGLPLVRALAMALGASVAIDSALGQGTRIAVTFPHDRLVPV